LKIELIVLTDELNYLRGARNRGMMVLTGDYKVGATLSAKSED
jgi:hypothetical protein